MMTADGERLLEVVKRLISIETAFKTILKSEELGNTEYISIDKNSIRNIAESLSICSDEVTSVLINWG